MVQKSIVKSINNSKNKLNSEIILIFHYYPKSKHTLKTQEQREYEVRRMWAVVGTDN